MLPSALSVRRRDAAEFHPPNDFNGFLRLSINDDNLVPISLSEQVTAASVFDRTQDCHRRFWQRLNYDLRFMKQTV